MIEIFYLWRHSLLRNCNVKNDSKSFYLLTKYHFLYLFLFRFISSFSFSFSRFDSLKLYCFKRKMLFKRNRQLHLSELLSANRKAFIFSDASETNDNCREFCFVQNNWVEKDDSILNQTIYLYRDIDKLKESAFAYIHIRFIWLVSVNCLSKKMKLCGKLAIIVSYNNNDHKNISIDTNFLFSFPERKHNFGYKRKSTVLQSTLD